MGDSGSEHSRSKHSSPCSSPSARLAICFAFALLLTLPIRCLSTPARVPCTFCLFVSWAMCCAATPFACTDHISVFADDNYTNCILCAEWIYSTCTLVTAYTIHIGLTGQKWPLYIAIRRSIQMICSVDYLREPLCCKLQFIKVMMYNSITFFLVT